MNAAEIEKITREAVADCSASATDADLEQARIRYLGRNGLLPVIMKGLGELSSGERGPVGRAANEFKQHVSDALASRKQELALQSNCKSIPTLDVTQPGQWRSVGSVHLISRIIEDVTRVFATLGFTVAEGPEVETRYNNFEALNTPAHHPSLDEKDTFWFADGTLLRTQTSPVQIRMMHSQRPPIRVITPGRVYRRDTIDATHSANFHQIEGLYVDTHVSLADLKGTLAHFARELMGPSISIRFRPHFFPFTEPSVECDFSCHVCGGSGCRVCKHSGWIEVLGAGMVDPRVFEKVGYDPERVSGFAFGMGVERIAMIKYGIHDLRHLYENDVRFLEQLRT
jgi:phenylalanyl-tRNA synthetase alpha chain